MRIVEKLKLIRHYIEASFTTFVLKAIILFAKWALSVDEYRSCLIEEGEHLDKLLRDKFEENKDDLANLSKYDEIDWKFAFRMQDYMNTKINEASR